MNENELEGGIEMETATEASLGVDGALALDLEPEITREQRRSRRKRDVRARTISVKRMTKRELEIGRLLFPETDYWKPRNRAECAEGPRPCPFVSCKHHLFIDVSPRTGAIKLNFPDLEVWDLGESCALDVADKHGTTLEDVGAIMNLTRERIRQVEVKALAKLAVDADLLVIADEVYEHLVFDGHRHIPLANYPGMADRTVTISSAAKMFNCTGWKIGWACGSAELIAGVRAAKQYLSYVGGAPFQPAVAHALNTEETWVAALRESLQAKRDKLGSALAELGFEVHDSFGTYFLCADPRPLGYHDSTEFCAQLPERAGVAAIPMSAFCDPGADHADAWNHLVRFAFCKRDETLDEAIRRLAVLRD